MAGKGGGAWKVAYADFVTAMMAFFLVMWLVAQDQQIKKAVSYYFMDPLGASKRPQRGGGIIPEDQTGTVPLAEKVGGGQGRNAYTATTNESGRATKAVGDWLRGDRAAREHWKTQAAACRDAANAAADAGANGRTRDEAAAADLSRRLKETLSHDVAAGAKGLSQDLLFASLAGVNWTELAEDLIYAR